MTAKPVAGYMTTGSTNCKLPVFLSIHDPTERSVWLLVMLVISLLYVKKLSSHLMLGKSQTLSNVKGMGRSMQSNEELNLCPCALYPCALSFIPVPMDTQKLLPMSMGTKTSRKATTNRLQIQGMLNSLSEVWSARTW